MSTTHEENLENANLTDENEELVEIQEEEEAPKSGSGKLWTIILGALLLVSVVGNVYLFLNNRKVKTEAESAKLEMQKLAVEKSLLEEKYASVNGENKELDRSLEEAFQNMADKDILIAHLNKENETLKQIKDEVDKITEITSSLKSQESAIRASKLKLQDVQNKVNRTIDEKHSKNLKITQGLQ